MAEYKNKSIGKCEFLIVTGCLVQRYKEELEKLLPEVDRKFKYKIYLSPLTAINIDRDNQIHLTDNRLLRRMIRDNRTRGYTVSDTLKLWKDVRAGEEKYIFPYQDEADYVFDSA